MTTTITITRTEAGYETSFPYELLESFKAAFPRAKWDRYRRIWSTGPRSGGRLEAWKNEAANVLAMLDEVNDATEASQDLDQSIRELDRLRGELECAREKRATLAEIQAALEERQDEIGKLSAELVVEKAAVAEERKILVQRVGQIIDLSALEASISRMRRNHEPSRRCRGEFNAGLAVVLESRETLEKAGLGSRALDYLSDISFNRPDRDRVDAAGDIVARIYNLENS